MRIPLVTLALASVAFAADIHGPFVQWYQDPCRQASVRWIEPARKDGTEGAWSRGPSGFGYGDLDDATVLRDMEGNYDTVAIRRLLGVPADLPKDAKLKLLARYDDAFTLWIDGKEVVSRNVRITDGGPRVIQKHEAENWEVIPLGLFAPGARLRLAAQGYNDGVNSSDFTLDLRVVAENASVSRELVATAAEWEYLAGREPEAGWRKNFGSEKVEPSDGKPVTFSYRISGSDEWKPVDVVRESFAGSAHTVAHADLDGLSPGALVEFRLNGETHRFTTAPEDVADMRFVTGGDMFHQRGLLDAMNARAGAEDPVFALLGGDLCYTNDQNPGRWFEWVDSWVENARRPDGRLLPMIVVIGNHEMKGAGYKPKDPPGPSAAREFFTLFGMPETDNACQTIDFGDQLSFVLLDSGHSASISSQTAWLDRVLTEREEVRRLFVCYHRPAWAAGTKEDAEDIQREWCPLFEKHLVDAVFENDHHTFSRSHPITAGKVDEKNGVPYLGAGAWGVGVRAVPDDVLAKRPWIAAAAGKNHLYVIDFENDGWSAVAKESDGSAFDRTERGWRR
ncbi:MAG: metallophosphoesterase [Akkermansiaceae bacterium]|nr:metallophosphoesterase [Akkermansiaceae bacterium]